MDLRLAPEAIQLRELIDRSLARLNTCLPGEILAFDPATQTATVRPCVPLHVAVNGENSFVDLPPIVNAPLVFPFASTAGFALTLPVRAGDPCLLVFSQRSIDRWHEAGGSPPPLVDRHHSLTDAFVLLAPSPLPGVLGAWEANGIELRNRARTVRATLTDVGVEIQAGEGIVLTISATGVVVLSSTVSVAVNAPLVAVDGNFTVSGTLVAQGAISSPTRVSGPDGSI